MKRILPGGLAAALIICTSLAGLPARVQADQVQNLNQTLPPHEESTIDQTALVALRGIVKARADLHRRAVTKARNELNDSARLLATIRDHLSTAVVRQRLEIAMERLEYEPASRVLTDIPAIDAALTEADVYLPTDQARRHLDKARDFLEKGNKEAAARELALTDSSLVIVEVELPLGQAEQAVQKAQHYLAGKDLAQAARYLGVAEQKADAITRISNSPLAIAERDVWQANQSYSAGQFAAAAADLQQARLYLDQAVRSGAEREKGEIGLLAAEVTDLGKRIQTEQGGVGAELYMTWERTKALLERSAEYLAADWQQSRTTLKGENNLIEAKLHLLYARTYQLTAGEPAKAVDELATTEAYLAKAQHDRLALGSIKTAVVAMERDVRALKAHPAEKDTAVQERYEQTLNGLRKLIRQM